MLMVENLFMLLFGHALADFVLQPEAMGYGKNRNDKIHDKKNSLFPVWWYWLTAHALVHGGVVYLVSNSLILGLVETALHWLTDFSKCENWISVHQDQGIHIGSKVAYCLFL